MSELLVEQHENIVPFGKGMLVLRIAIERSTDSYGNPPIVRQKQLSFQDSEGAVAIGNLPEIARIAAIKGIDVGTQVSLHTVGFAQLVAEFESLGTVLLPGWRHMAFQEEHGIDLTVNQPRIENGELRFVTANLRIQDPSRLIKDVHFSLNKTTYFAISIKIV